MLWLALQVVLGVNKCFKWFAIQDGMVLKKVYISCLHRIARVMAQTLTIQVKRIRYSTKHYVLSPLQVLARLLQLLSSSRHIVAICVDEYGRRHEVDISSVKVSGNKVYIEFDKKIRCVELQLELREHAPHQLAS
jgi:hypothetical protein